MDVARGAYGRDGSPGVEVFDEIIEAMRGVLHDARRFISGAERREPSSA